VRFKDAAMSAGAISAGSSSEKTLAISASISSLLPTPLDATNGFRDGKQSWRREPAVRKPDREMMLQATSR